MYSYYLSDAQLNTRNLVDENGTVTDTYDYDAFGNIMNMSGDTENEFLYTGQQYDANAGLYYLRARYMDTASGRFINRDYYDGNLYSPASLHKYTYVHNNPVMGYDPTGLILWFLARGILAHRYIETRYNIEHPYMLDNYKHQYVDKKNNLGYIIKTGFIDICDHKTKEIYEIKPQRIIMSGQKQLDFYLDCLNSNKKQSEFYHSGESWPIDQISAPWIFDGTITYGLKAPGLIYYNIDGDNIGKYKAILLGEALGIAMASASIQKIVWIEHTIKMLPNIMKMQMDTVVARVQMSITRGGF